MNTTSRIEAAAPCSPPKLGLSGSSRAVDTVISTRSRVRKWFSSQEAIVFTIALMAAFIFWLLLPRFATFGNAMAMLRSVSVLGILALGMAIVMIGRGIDLSQIATALIAAGFAGKLVLAGVGAPAAMATGLGAALILGCINGAIVAYLEIPALFATLATSLLFVGLARSWLLGSMMIHLPAEHEGLMFLGQNWYGVPVPLVAFLLCAVVVHLFLNFTVLGRFIYAHGDNPAAARLSGIAVRRLTLLEYALCAAIAYIGGLVTVASTAIIDLNAVNSSLIFEVIMVAVLGGVSLVGGRGSVLNVLAGTALIGVLLNGMAIMDLDYHLQSIIKGAVLLSAIILDRFLHPRDEETARQGD
jgi:ribose transport system permease protein